MKHLISRNTSISGDIYLNPNLKSPEQEQQLSLQVDLLQAIVESFVDGIVILNTQGKILHANEYGRAICDQKNQNYQLPREIWQICESLIESREIFPGENIFLETNVEIQPLHPLRVRVRWLEFDENQKNLLVTLEDSQQTNQSIAIADVQKYGLTDREAEVWLLRCTNCSYKEIAKRLYITINTVKKHLKNIHAKQQEMLWS
ncbi:helix-turn-helix transcriptional regulator [Calothrix sp. 336/3]|uniref:helix-turn-helix transcriptional regulator n=1 Tax=Calothrix sp. 336/3 TaxID=1337936 RepID=UPI0009E1B267|nr:LuxR C-terminal-related transcriptional regulator [Calothrix sp. 336/3]